MNRCRNCNAVVNNKWKKCLVCESPLNLNYTRVSPMHRDEVASMELTEFAKRNLAIQVYSELLGQQMCFVSNQEIRKKVAKEGLPTYLPHELEHLITVKATSDEIKKIHMIKELFPESIIR